ncbi:MULTISPECIES: DUF6461 domain-containing protein [unclassified Nocardioides]|uniref:DUF6461 domain-containing protein n=1 Tax=unclassified Nocardioides TaxID=2615069 RepID=UPI000AD876E2|nr:MULTISPECIES: DUF6461 domain-containing protein [unclassified Nocardioides]
MRCSRWLPLLAVVALGISGCGDADSSAGASEDTPDDAVSAYGVLISEDESARTNLGEYADLGDGLRVRLDITDVGGDELGPWLTVTMRTDNQGADPQPVPRAELHCEQSDDPGMPWTDDDADSSGPEDRVLAGDSFERNAKLLLPGDSHMGGPIPECEGEAYLAAATYGDDWNNALASAEWSVPAAIVDELNEARLDAQPSPTLPPEPAKDPDRPYAWVDQDQYSSGYQVVVVPGIDAAQALKALAPIRRKASRDNFWAVVVAEREEGVVLFTYGLIPDERVQALSRGGIAASYGNTVNGDDHVLVARDGKVVRSFDPFLDFDYAKTKPLPEEKGLDLENDTWAASWTLLERLTKIHVTEEWLFGAEHPAYLLDD